MGRKGDGEKGRKGDGERNLILRKKSSYLPISPSPHLPFSLSLLKAFGDLS